MNGHGELTSASISPAGPAPTMRTSTFEGVEEAISIGWLSIYHYNEPRIDERRGRTPDLKAW
jgi:hypothetical protein